MGKKNTLLGSPYIGGRPTAACFSQPGLSYRLLACTPGTVLVGASLDAVPTIVGFSCVKTN